MRAKFASDFSDLLNSLKIQFFIAENPLISFPFSCLISAICVAFKLSLKEISATGYDKKFSENSAGGMTPILIVVALLTVLCSPSSAFCIHVGGAFTVMGATLVSVFDMLITYVFRYDSLHLSHITVLPAAHHGEVCKVSSSVGSYGFP